MSKGKNVLFLTPRLPWPLIGGDRIKSYYLLKHLAKNHNVKLISFFYGNEDYSEYVKELEKLNIKVVIHRIKTVPRILQMLPKMFFRKPLEILWFTDKNFQKDVNDSIVNDKIDIGFAFFMRTAEYLIGKNISKVHIAEDCRTTYQYRSYKASKSIPQRMIRWWEYNKLKNYEPTVIDKFDYTTLVSEEDIKYMQDSNPSAKLKLLTNGTDIDILKPDPNVKRKYLLLTGKLNIWANQLMISKILKKFLPKLIEKYPDIVFKIVGAEPPDWVKELESKNIEIHSDVPSMMPFYQGAAVFLHPHYGATGIQNKLLEAMSSGCPVVTTITGNQGIHGEHGKDLMLAKNDDEFLQYVMDLYDNPELAKTVGDNARKLIIETHSWQVINKQLDDIISDVCP
ncbi:glycosyltransferase [Candidatus Kapabacteria bacterium]|nr:glycosyltransferase [Candidatus Kapabacteria bacterium]